MQLQMFLSRVFPLQALLVLQPLMLLQMFPSLAFPLPARLGLRRPLARQLLALPE
jgi:hypothetical protein